MEKQSESDPMEYLKKMRLRTAEILDHLDGTEEHVLTARIANTEIASDSKFIESQKATKGDSPPAGLTPSEEVEWWRNKVAILSVPVDISDDKPSGRIVERKIDPSDHKIDMGGSFSAGADDKPSRK